MRLIYITMRKAQIPKTFNSVTYPALVQGLKLPRNYRPITQPGLVQALEDVLERVKSKPSEAAIVTNAAGNKNRIKALLDLMPSNLVISIVTIDPTGTRNVASWSITTPWRNVYFFDTLIQNIPKSTFGR